MRMCTILLHKTGDLLSNNPYGPQSPSLFNSGLLRLDIKFGDNYPISNPNECDLDTRGMTIEIQKGGLLSMANRTELNSVSIHHLLLYFFFFPSVYVSSTNQCADIY